MNDHVDNFGGLWRFDPVGNAEYPWLLVRPGPSASPRTEVTEP